MDTRLIHIYVSCTWIRVKWTFIIPKKLTALKLIVWGAWGVHMLPGIRSFRCSVVFFIKKSFQILNTFVWKKTV